jgi:hypothetical protein
VVRGLDASDLAADARIVLVERRADGRSVIETPRYRAYTEVLVGLAARGRDLAEIAGNDEVMLTVPAPAGTRPPAGAQPLLTVPVQARPGSERVVLAVRVEALCALLRGLQRGAISLEHVYDRRPASSPRCMRPARGCCGRRLARAAARHPPGRRAAAPERRGLARRVRGRGPTAARPASPTAGTTVHGSSTSGA